MREEKRIFVIKAIAAFVIITTAMIIAVLLVDCISASIKAVMNYTAQHTLRMPMAFFITLCAVIVPSAAGAGAFVFLWKQLAKLIQL